MNEELPAGWEWATVGEVTEPVEQRGPGPEPTFRYIDIGAVDNGSKKIADTKLLSVSEAPSRARQNVRASDVLVSMTRPNLNAVALVPDSLEGAVASTGFHILRTPHIEPRWLFAAVRSPEFIRVMTEQVQGALYPAVRPSDIRKYRLPIPPLAEQQRILKKLDELLANIRAARASLDAAHELCRDMRVAILNAAYSGTILKHAASGEQTTARLWDTVAFEDILADKDKLSYGVLKPGVEDPSGVPMFRVVDIGDWGQRSRTSPMMISRALSREFQRTVIEPGDVLLSVMATVGRAMVATEDMAGGNVNRALAVIKPDRNKIDPHFLLYVLLSPRAAREFEDRSIGSAQPRINLGTLRSLEVPLPPLEEQHAIAESVRAHFVSVEVTEARCREALEALDRMEASILAKAMRGELVPQDPNDEPASVLVERARVAGPPPHTRRSRTRSRT